MTFSVGAGFIPWTSSRHFVVGADEARVQPGPEIQLTSPPDSECVVSLISTGILHSAAQVHQVDLERVNQRTQAKRQLKVTLEELKKQAARKTAARTRPAGPMTTVELAYLAS